MQFENMSTLVMFHVLICLFAIASGMVLVVGLFKSALMPNRTAVFLSSNILTNATGFLIPPFMFERLLPSHIIGVLSLLLLGCACYAYCVKKLSGSWRWIYVSTALTSLYANVFVLVTQLFLKVPALHMLAPTVPPSGMVFTICQAVVFAVFSVLTFSVVRRYRPVDSVMQNSAPSQAGQSTADDCGWTDAFPSSGLPKGR